MQIFEDMRRLLGRLDDGPVSAVTVILKCVAGFLILLAIIAGPWSVS